MTDAESVQSSPSSSKTNDLEPPAEVAIDKVRKTVMTEPESEAGDEGLTVDATIVPNSPPSGLKHLE